MFRFIFRSLALLGCASTAGAHFVFVVPDKDAKTAQVIMSESLQPDTQVPIQTIAGTQLIETDSTGHDTTLKLSKAEHAFTVDLTGNATGVIHGISEQGIYQHGTAKPCLLNYYPKTILGNPFDAKTRLGDKVPVELVPTGQAGRLKFQLLANGKPVPDAEVNLILPDGTDQKVDTDKDGNTPVFEASGRFGVWARHVEPIAGALNGKQYDEVRQYATLVIDVPATPAVSTCAPMPQAASSFGAVACDGWLYIYGGHTADTHSYSTDSVSGQFHRLNLSDHKTWEKLEGGPPLQGLNLATWHGKIYRVGGMCPRNKAGEPADVRSVADCACFDPETKKWTAIPSLPEPRSSHDLAVVGNQLFVVGGWNLTGDADEAKWTDNALMLDLSAGKPEWKTVKEPFHRRALIAAVYQGKVYVIGGFEFDSDPSKRVDIYDPVANTWSTGPELPGDEMNGFGPAACTAVGRLYVSVADGTLYRLDKAGKAWEKVTATTPRIVHRLAPNGTELLVIGGAAKKKQLDLIETVAVSDH